MIDFVKHEDGTITYVWPKGVLAISVSEEFMEVVIENHNRSVKMRAALEYIAQPPLTNSYHHELLRCIQKAKEAINED
jgi:hypothetical protein